MAKMGAVPTRGAPIPAMIQLVRRIRGLTSHGRSLEWEKSECFVWNAAVWVFGLIQTFYQSAPSDDQLYISRSARWTGDTEELQSVIYCRNGIAKLGREPSISGQCLIRSLAIAGLQPHQHHLSISPAPTPSNQSQRRKTFLNSC